MKSWWASVALVALAGTGRCDCATLHARLSDPTVGVAFEKNGPVTAMTKAEKAAFVGCVLDYANLPDKSKVSVEWHFYASLSAQTPYVLTEWDAREVAGNGDVTAEVEARPVEGVTDGVYECSWRVESTAKVENPTPSARIVIGAPPP